MKPHQNPSRLTATLLIALAISVVVASLGCASEGLFDSDAGLQGRPPAYEDQQILDAEATLRAHSLRSARDQYDRIVRDGDQGSRGTAAAGRALVNIMLLPEDPAVQRLLVDHLGATRADYDAERLIWADEGILYWLARGTSWDDNGQLQGIRSLVADKLPWATARLDSPDAFLDGLDSTGSEALDALLPITRTLEGIEEDLGRALGDAAFVRFYVPAEVFHDEDMGLVLGRAEVSLLRGAVALVRGGLIFIAAYEHAFQLSHLSEARWAAILADPMHPEHQAALTTADAYLFTYLDSRLLRSFRDASRLAEARRAAQRGLDAIVNALTLGRERAAQGSSLQWQSGSAEVSDQLIALIRAASSSMERPTKLPYTTPAATLNLSVFFGDGRLVPAQTPLFASFDEPLDDGMGGTITDTSWELSEEATTSLTQGLLTPEDGEITLDLDGGLESYQRAVSGELVGNINDAYLGSR
jgi:hypothetical protein